MASVFDFADPVVMRSACHESAHCVVAFMMHLPIKSADLYDRYAGCVEHPEDLYATYAKAAGQAVWERKMAAVALGGMLAEHFVNRMGTTSRAIAALSAPREFWTWARSTPDISLPFGDLDRVARYSRTPQRAERLLARCTRP